MIKLSSLLKEIKVIPSDDRLVIQLSATDEDGEARDKTTLIFPKHGSQLDPEDKAYLESEEVGIPEESGFYIYLDLALNDFENQIQQLGDNSDRSQVEDLIIELVKDLSKYIEENEAYSIGDTSPRDDIAYNIKEKFKELFPTVNTYFVGLGWYTFSNGLVESLVEGDPSFLIDFTFGGDINEEFTRIQKLAGIISEIKTVPPDFTAPFPPEKWMSLGKDFEVEKYSGSFSDGKILYYYRYNGILFSPGENKTLVAEIKYNDYRDEDWYLGTIYELMEELKIDELKTILDNNGYKYEYAIYSSEIIFKIYY